jgi:mono/diheme cytochrome c family protein
MRTTSPLVLGIVLATALAASAAEPPAKPLTPEAAEFFESKVRPMLLDNCISCHGPEKQKSGLRLDSREWMLKGTDEGPALVPGDPEKSSIVKAARYTDDLKMPPKGKMPAESVEVLTAWVKMGAPWPASTATQPIGDPVAEARKSHWSFQPVRKPAAPAIKHAGWVSNEIDRFVLAKLEAQNIAPAPLADRRTLLRRVTFDLTGLPPTPAEVDAFLADQSTDAYDKVIDRLLASPQYGERWGRYWLDVARYADTKGYVFTEERRYPFSYTYRDYVIRSFNEDLPYDRFIIEQLAADKLNLADPHPLAAMGFLTLGRRFLNNVPDIIDDRIDVTMRGLQGMTVGCARCHDHKFDPIPTKDYYSLYGVFNSSVEPKDLPLIAHPEQTAAVVAFEKGVQEREKKLNDYLHAQYAELLAKLRNQAGEALLAVRDAESLPGEEHYLALNADDLNPATIRRWQAFLKNRQKKHDPIFAPWAALAALPTKEFADKAPALIAKFAANEEKEKPIHPLVAKAFAEGKPVTLPDVAKLYGQLFKDTEKAWQEALKRSPETKALSDGDHEALRQVLYAAGVPANPTLDEAKNLVNRAVRDHLTSLQKEVDRFKASSPAAPPRAMVLNDTPQPHEPRVFLRGNPNNQGDQVPRQYLRVIAGDDRKPFKQGSGRLELAQAIASKDNPLTARVMVNRIWLNHFGQGLVRTPSDFGLRGEPPTHPELLDWLAAEFMERGWSIKQLHRLILTSNTYKQSSAVRPELASDPDNRLLGRMNRRRLDFEGLRDALLAVSGELDLKTGGPGVELTQAPFPARRTVYGFIERQNLPGLFRTFDFASPDTTSAQRFVTTVPQQALFLMNSPFVVQQARHLAERPDVAGLKDDAQRVQRLYRLCYGRAPDADELKLGLLFAQSAETASEPVWQYGYGEYDAEAKRVKEFHSLPHWTGSAWQGGASLPDGKTGWVMLTAQGGHPGNDLRHAAIRRWVAPCDGTISIEGTINHPAKEGDGIQARVVSSRGGEFGSWTVQHGKADAKVAALEVKHGDTIDFMIDCRSAPNFDSFEWAPVIRLAGKETKTWSAATDFAGPPTQNPWVKYAQVLLLTNEFAFVD